MSFSLAASHRSALIRLASGLPKESTERAALLSVLREAAQYYNWDGKVLTFSELRDLAVGKAVSDSGSKFSWHVVMPEEEGSSVTQTFEVTPMVWWKINLPNLTNPRIWDRILDGELGALKKKKFKDSMRLAIEFNEWAKKTNPSKEEMIAWLKKLS